MTLRRASLILPCPRLDDYPTHLTGDRAAELLAGWTALWHPALLDALGGIPAWRTSDDLPDPSEFDGELVVLPETSRLRMSADWADRFRATSPKNPPPIEAAASREKTIAAVLEASGLTDKGLPSELVGDFLALGHAHLQVELLTRAMRYSSVLDVQLFENAAVAAARAAAAGDTHQTREELARSFDLLADARNHVYSVDFYVVDVTLLAPSTLGDDLRSKLAFDTPTNMLASGELLEQLAEQHPATLAELRRAIEAGTACVIGGTYHTSVSSFASPETWLDEISRAQRVAHQHLQRDYQVFGQFHTAFSPVLPGLLVNTGFSGALHASFDGGRLPQTEQVKTWWGSGDRGAIQALAARPLDISRPETWLKLASKIGDTIATDHVATMVLAGWPGAGSEYYDDLRRAARYGPVLGKLVTLEEYFRVTREPDDWTKFHTREYPARSSAELGPNPISAQVDAYRRDVDAAHRQLAHGLASMIGAATDTHNDQPANAVVVNPWNFPCTKLFGADPVFPEASGATGSASAPSAMAINMAGSKTSEHPCTIPDVPGWGFATFAAAAPTASIAMAEDRILRNERLEVTISEATGGIQSVRTYHDRSTRISQRLVFHRGRIASPQDSQMISEHIRVTRNDALFGEIESTGRLLDSAGEPLAGFTQRVRIARGMPAVFVDVSLEPQRLPDGDLWRSYYASRLACADDAITVRRGGHWMAHETGRERIETPEWVEITDTTGQITCLAFGLPYHRRASPSWLDTLFVVAGEERRQFQFALAVDEAYPCRAALGLATSGQAPLMTLPNDPPASRGWFLHIGARNVVATHLERLAGPPEKLRLRVLETEGRATTTTLTAFGDFTAAQITDFRGNSTAVLSVNDGHVEFDLEPHGWIQIEAEW
jgi:alpha-mannosidase